MIGVRRLAGWMALGVALFSALPLVLFAAGPSLTVDFAADPPRRVFTGIYPAERAPDGLTFVWTRETFGLTLPRLDRGLTWRLTLHLAASRPDGSTPTLITTVDGITASTTTLPAGGFAGHAVTIPARADRPRTTSVGFRVTPPFTPAGDPRELGAQIDRITLRPERGGPVLAMDWRATVAWGVVAGALASVLAVPVAVAVIWLLVTATLAAMVATTGLAPYAGAAWWPALFIGAGAAAIAAAVLPRSRAGAAVAVLITFTAAAVHGLVVLHIDMPIGDALFHAHRFQEVLGGRYFFTSIAPGDYQFPYPIGLYLAAAPFARFTGSALENATLLRIVVVIVNAAAAALIYRLAARWRSGDEVTGAAAVASFHLVPLSFGVIGTGNLTNAFAQSMATVSMVVAGAIAAGRPGVALSVVLFAAASIAFLSHTSTFAVLAVQLVAVGIGLALLGRTRLLPRARRTGLPGGGMREGSTAPTWTSRGGLIVAATIAAVTVSVLVYYARFGEVYREAWGRIAAETGRATEAAGGRTPYVRLIEAPQWLVRYYGWPLLLSAVVGAGAIVRGRIRLAPEISMLLIAWLGAAACFLVIGIVTPVDLRHFYAAAPAVALLSALGCSWLWRIGVWSAAAVVVLAGWAMWIAWNEAGGRFLAGW
jgi:hypothetical protein